MGPFILLAVIVGLFVAYFFAQVSELKKGQGLSTKEAIRTGLRSMLSLIVIFCLVIAGFVVYAFLRFL